MFQKISLIIAICSPLMGVSQNLEQDFDEIVRHMTDAKSVSIEVAVEMYNRKGGKVAYSAKAALDKLGENGRTVLAEMEYIRTEDYILKIDKEEKAMLILKKENLKVPENIEMPDIDVEKLKKALIPKSTDAQSVKLISSQNGRKKYSVRGLKGMKEIVVELDLNKKTIVSVRYEYGSENLAGQYVVLKYEKFAYNTNLANKFDLTSYFKIENNKYVLSPVFKGYKIYTEE